MTIMSMINGHTPVFQCIGDAYIKRDAQRFYYAYLLCIRAKTDLNTLHKYLINRYNFNRSVCAQLLKKARIK
jgi:transcription-repair coupling factor (superfamily II helicase)